MIILFFSLAGISQTVEAPASNTKLTSSNEKILLIKDIYEEKIGEEIKDNIIDKIYTDNVKDTPYITKQKIEYSFTSAKNMLSENGTFAYEEYYSLVSMILSAIDMESDFENKDTYNSVNSIDYGLMQINTCNIPIIEKELGILDIRNSTKDNIEAGSWIIYNCYIKAFEEHPDDILLYTYSYYNRGIYFENFEYDKNQMYKRGDIFADKYFKYYKTIIKEIDKYKKVY